MNREGLTGWKDVFTFTLIQTLKTKAFIISTIIMLLLMLVSMPIVGMLTSGKGTEDNGPISVKKVYVDNKTTLPDMEYDEVLKDEKLSHISFEEMGEDYETVAKRIEEGEKDSVILTISEDGNRYSLSIARASKGPVSGGSIGLLSEALLRQFESFKISTLGITKEQLSLINADVRTKVSMADESGREIEKVDTSISSAQYWFLYGTLFIVMMVNILASTQIAYSIAGEKSTRVIEYLLITVKPLAIIVGKILAMLTAVLLQVTAMISVAFLSNRISAGLSSGGESVMSRFLPKDIFQNLNIINILLCLILIVVGMILYATLAGLAGATVSKLEEINEALSVFSFVNLIGFYVGMGAAIVLMSKGINGYVIFSFLFPLSSPFLLPGAILIGKATLAISAAAIGIEIVSIILLFKFVARVYGALILHSGNKIKIKELVKLSKTV